MCREKSASRWRPAAPPVLLDRAKETFFDDVEGCDPPEPTPRWDDLRDAFELDDEITDPQPEEGDFWGQPDSEEQI